MAKHEDPMLNQHVALNRVYTRMREVQREAHERIVTRPAAPLVTGDPDKVFDEGAGLPKEERGREFLKTLHDPRLRAARLDQVVAQYPKMPKGLIPREIVDFYIDGIKEFGLFG